MQKLTRNTFEGGRNTDVDKIRLNPNFYTDAHNVELVGGGDFTALTNIRGTTNVQNILNNEPTVNVLGVFENRYTINGVGTDIQCLTIFTTTDTTFKIWCYDTENDALYELYEDTVTGYNSTDRIVDAKAFAENGQDILYFTDNFHEVRQLRCEIPDPYLANFLTDEQLSLQRRGAVGKAELLDIITGGTLLSGSYQFAYRMADPTKKRFTKWSSLTNPIHVYNESEGSGPQPTVLGYIKTSFVDGDNGVANCSGNPDYTRTITVDLVDDMDVPITHSEDITVTFAATSVDPYGSYNTNFNITIPAGDSTASLLYTVDSWAIEDFACRNFQLIVDISATIGIFSPDGGLFLEFGAPNPSSTTRSIAGIGMFTDKKIQLRITPSASEVLNFTHYQLAVVENIYPLESSEGLAANLLAMEEFTGPTYEDFDYVANTKIDKIPIEDIVIDLAAIETAKTINVKQNRIFIGNINYHDLEMDNGVPSLDDTVTSELITRAVNYNDAEDSSRYVGHFRDEVYRYGVVYLDKYGNRSAPQPLDMGEVTNNQAGAFDNGFKDMKFPSRDFDGDYSILDSNSVPRALGLRLSLVNHPTWAVAFEIVRVKRKKRIQFQTPVVPFMYVKGVGAKSNYPSKQYNRHDNSSTNIDYPDAQPMTSDQVYMPKNFMYPEFRDIEENPVSLNRGTQRNSSKGEAFWRVRNEPTNDTSPYDVCGIFPPETMYGGTPYNFSGAATLDTVDFAMCKINVENFSDDEVPNPGDNVSTNVSANVHAIEDKQYYYGSAHLNQPLPDTELNPVTTHTANVIEYKMFDNLSEGNQISGKFVLRYDMLETKGGGQIGYKPSTQKMAVVSLDSPFDDNHEITFQGLGGTRNKYVPITIGTKIFGATGAAYLTDGRMPPTGSGADPDYKLRNEFIINSTGYPGYTQGDYVHAVRVANMVDNKIGDSRYGDVDDLQEYISTGTFYTFTPSELAIVEAGTRLVKTVDVWGGDCFIAPHTFKISDRTYSVFDQTKHLDITTSNDNLAEYWGGKWYKYNSSDGSNSNISIPVGLRGCSQFIEVFLESEYNGGVMDIDPLKVRDAFGNTPILNYDTKDLVISPLTYNFNINIAKQNSQKVYIPKPQFSFVQNSFPARVMWSDTKIYNSDIQGFDIFRVLNFYDLQEDMGDLTKIAIAGDAMYAIQEMGIKYLPTGQSQLEQTDAGTIAVGTSDVIGRAITVDAKRGSQHIAGIVETGSTIYIPDARNKAVYALGGQELSPISAINNETIFREIFATNYADQSVRGIYDPVRRQYWCITGSRCDIYNEKGQWISNLEFSGALKGGVYTNKNLYLIGSAAGSVDTYTFYTGTINSFMGTTVIPRVTVAVNPDVEYSKTFDNMMFVATERLDEIDLVVEREQSLGNQLVSGINLDRRSVEGNYRIKTLRDNDSARLRGLKMLATVKWSDAAIATLSAIMTKYRTSSRTPF
jgi:hypothetical protein